MVRISTNQYHQTAVNALLNQQAKLSEVQEQLATGRKILNPSDDPSGSARVLELAQSIESSERYNRNIGFAESRMGLEESVLDEASSSLQRIRELTIQARNGSNTAEDRQKIASEVREQWQHLRQLANSTDGNGEYLFAGSQTETRPFVTRNGEVAYEGDQNVRKVQVGPGRTMATTHSGYDVFMDLPTSYRADADAGNTGNGSVAVYVDQASANDVSGYNVTFSTPAGGGDLEYTVTDAGTPPNTVATGIYEPGEPIELSGDGVTIVPHGNPADGDSFTIASGDNRSVFATVDRLASALEGAGDSNAARNQFQAAGDRALAEIDAAMENMQRVRAEIGGRMNGLDSERNANEAAALEMKTTRSEIRDLDYASAVSELSRRMAGMQAAQQSYSKIQGMTLFNYL